MKKTEARDATRAVPAMVGLRTVPPRLAPRVGRRRAALGGGVALGPAGRVHGRSRARRRAGAQDGGFHSHLTLLLWTNVSVVISAGLRSTARGTVAGGRRIADHYDDLPDHLVLLSDSGPHRHTPPHYARAAAATGRAAATLSARRVTTRTTRRPSARGSGRRASSTVRRAAAPSASARCSSRPIARCPAGERRRRAPTCSTPRAATNRPWSRAAIRMHPRAAYAELPRGSAQADAAPVRA